jgi:hypothetical protein
MRLRKSTVSYVDVEPGNCTTVQTAPPRSGTARVSVFIKPRQIILPGDPPSEHLPDSPLMHMRIVPPKFPVPSAPSIDTNGDRKSSSGLRE